MDFKLERDMIRFLFLSLAVARKSTGAWQEWQHVTRKEAIPVVQVSDGIVCTRGWLLRWRNMRYILVVYFDDILRYLMLYLDIFWWCILFSQELRFGYWIKKNKHVFSLSNVVKAVPFTGMIFIYSGYPLWLTENKWDALRWGQRIT